MSDSNLAVVPATGPMFKPSDAPSNPLPAIEPEPVTADFPAVAFDGFDGLAELLGTAPIFEPDPGEESGEEPAAEEEIPA